MQIFDFQDYRTYIRSRQKTLPKNGWGFVSQLAKHLGINQVQVSQVLGGKKDFTLEQAVDIADFFSLSSIEKEYLIWLVIKARAGTHRLTHEANGQLKAIKNKSLPLGKCLPPDKWIFHRQWQLLLKSTHLEHA